MISENITIKIKKNAIAKKKNNLEKSWLVHI